MEQLSWKREGSTLVLAGELDGDTVQSLWQERAQVMAGVQTFNLARLTRVDTAGLALLIHLVDLARKQGGELALQGASDKLQTLVKLYNLPDGLLPAFTSQ
ncbi:lipid asymmetry maintenance protein MlaB [Enterobacteriaceae bacterium H20N1]|uniref:Lipid asymmetry maintenance protein MlaB n=1 Tax=Dryocola boscaweniae TaxID=2925397 RepID=A0A9X2W9V5_9ENTR|nr:lipid asymmetry maintenance protein MlaB [Dryocola boscaweniae]MCT4701984.1 lipid asymmetry maintenance protein MlaB [Dryocola boscaweniae]MCT4719152.1 lipid asymmetry maintenance protein MlaB [Dryocola boscaweniae]